MGPNLCATSYARLKSPLWIARCHLGRVAFPVRPITTRCADAIAECAS